MSSATIYQQAYHPRPAPERRFGYSVAASGVVHVLLIIALASVRPTFTLPPSLLGLAGTLQVQLTEQTVPVIEPLPEPMTPIAVPRFLPTPQPVALEALLRNPPVPQSAASGTTTTQPLVVRQGPPNPNGSVAVGPLGNPERVSVATAARLAQRFPEVDHAELEQRVRSTYERLERQATVDSHLVAMTEGQVTDELRKSGETVHVRGDDLD